MTSKKANYDCVAKVVILGDSSVGKTNILLRFAQNIYRPSHVATIGVDFKNKAIDIDGRLLKLQLWDTAGQQRFKTIAQTYYKNSAGIVLVYSVQDRKTFSNLSNWINQIKENSEENIPKIIVGNKCDVQNRTVSTEQGRMLAAKYGVQYIECSAQEDFNIKEIFLTLGRQILQNSDKFKTNNAPSGMKIDKRRSVQNESQKKCCS